jgi:hypothetical protein
LNVIVAGVVFGVHVAGVVVEGRFRLWLDCSRCVVAIVVGGVSSGAFRFLLLFLFDTTVIIVEGAGTLTIMVVGVAWT